MKLTYNIIVSEFNREVCVYVHKMQVKWGEISMVEAERRLLANAFQDPNNQHFVLVSLRHGIYIEFIT